MFIDLYCLTENMKRFVVSILAILYLATASGATVHLHYCMGKLVGASLMQHEDHKCGRCGMKKKTNNGCCKDEHKIIKTDQEHMQAAKVLFDQSNQLIAEMPIQHYYCNSYPVTTTLSVTKMYSPPLLWRDCPIYLKVRNIRI